MTAKKTKAKTYRTLNSSRNFTKPIILAVILISALAIVAALVATYFLNPERRVKELISQLSTEYYEDYYYDKYTSASFNTPEVQEDLKNGLSSIPLRQILLYDNQKNDKHAEFLSSYCDEDSTYIIIYPDPPYDKKSYHMDFSYSCNF